MSRTWLTAEIFTSQQWNQCGSAQCYLVDEMHHEMPLIYLCKIVAHPQTCKDAPLRCHGWLVQLFRVLNFTNMLIILLHCIVPLCSVMHCEESWDAWAKSIMNCSSSSSSLEYISISRYVTNYDLWHTVLRDRGWTALVWFHDYRSHDSVKVRMDDTHTIILKFENSTF